MAVNKTSPAGKFLPDVIISHMIVLAGTEAYGIDFDQFPAAGSKPVSKRDGWYKPRAAILDMKIKYITTDGNCIIIEGEKRN